MKKRTGGSVPTTLPQLLQGSREHGHGGKVPGFIHDRMGALLGCQRLEGRELGSRCTAPFWKLRLEKTGEVQR